MTDFVEVRTEAGGSPSFGPPREGEGGEHRIFKSSAGSEVTWYLAASEGNAVRELEELARAFVGASYATVRRLSTEEAAMPTDLSMGEVVVVAPMEGRESVVQKRLLTISSLLSSRPARESRVARALRHVLADLRVAMAARDRQGAEDLLSELETRNDITRTNLAFLRIQMLARLGAFEEVLSHPDLTRIAGSRRPRDVTQALLEAVAASFEDSLSSDNREDWAAAGTHARRLLGPVAETVIPPRSVAEAKVFLAAELAGAEPELDRVRDAIDYLSQHGEAVQDLLRDVDSATEESPAAISEEVLPDVLRFMNRRQFGQALLTLQDAEPGVDLAWAAYNIHAELGTDASQRVFQRLAGPIREELARDVAHVPLLDALEELSGGGRLVEDPDSWGEWLARAQAGATEHELVAMAERGAGGWPVDAATASALASFISQDASLTLRPIYGSILERHEDVLTTSAGTELLLEVIELVATVGPTSEEYGVLPGWFEEVVAARNDEATLGRLTDVVEIVMSDHPSPVTVAAVADLIGALAHHPTHRGSVLQLAESAATWMRKYTDVADDAARLALAQALRELGAPREEGDPFWSPTASSVLERLRGKHLGIYTLMTSVAARIKRTLEDWVGDGDVEVNGDAVATERLTALAQDTDVMFVVTGAAKHPATDAIKAARGNLPLVQIHRKGFTALYEAVRTWAAGVVED